jgi:hypothetical protein
MTGSGSSKKSHTYPFLYLGGANLGFSELLIWFVEEPAEADWQEIASLFSPGCFEPEFEQHGPVLLLRFAIPRPCHGRTGCGGA